MTPADRDPLSDRALLARCYRLLLHLYPPSFRRRFGADMAELFSDRCRQAERQRGRTGLLLACRRALSDLLVHAAAERWSARTARRTRRAARPARRPTTGDLMATLAQDLRYALRGLRNQPGFTAVAVLTLTLGIGANSTIFSLVEAALLRPLPYAEPERLVRIQGVRLDGPEGGGGSSNLSAPDFLDYARMSRSLDSAGVHGWTGGTVTLTAGGAEATIAGAGSAGIRSAGVGGAEAEQVPAARVSSGIFRTLGVQPALGRLFGPDEDRPGRPEVAVISNALWQRRFAADPGIVGRSIQLNGTPVPMVGVLPADFRYPEPDTLRGVTQPDVLRPIDFDPKQSSRDGRYLHGVGRLRPGVSRRAAEAEIQAIAARLRKLYPVEDFARSVRLVGLADDLVAGARPVLVLLLGAVACVLLIACANIANLLLARGTTRRSEMAMRAALGAAPGRLLRLLLTESLVLALGGGALGVALAAAAIRLLSAWGHGLLPRAAAAGLNGPVLVYSAALALATGLVFGLASSFQSTRPSLGEDLRRGTAGAGSSRGAGAARRALVVAEVALSLLLLIAAGLLIESFWRLRRVDPGFSPERVLSFQLSLPLSRYPEGSESRFYERLYKRVATLPGVEAAGGANMLPLSGDYSCDGIQIDAHPVPKAQAPCAEARSVSPGYFRALRIPLLAGRLFDGRDAERSTAVAIVNRAMARRFWPGQDPLGKTFVYLGREQGNRRLVVGVAGDLRHFGIEREPEPEFYTPQMQQPSYHAMAVVVRAAADPGRLLPALRRAVAALDPLIPVYRPRALSELVAADIAAPRLRTTILGAFAGLALLLALVGIYGVLAFIVGQRTREIGIRKALGASHRDLLRLLLAQTMAPALAGIALGLAAAFLAARALGGLLFGVAPTDPLLFTLAPLLLGAAALLASYLPTRRAASIEPRIALQAE